MGDFSKFLAIRQAYSELLPEWMGEYEKTGEMRQDPYFMDWEFTRIERNVWSDIRALGLPFYPQIPVLNYFIDFGCPFLKIGIECDGKAWHDHDLDKARDARLAAEGWMIFRIEGHECVRVVEPWQEYTDEENPIEVDRYFLATSEGVLRAIKCKYFGGHADRRYNFMIESTLFEHRSTPETEPVRRPMTKKTGPIRLSELIGEHLSLIERRLKRQTA